MPRRLFLILSALSLVLCIATCAVWVRSYRAANRVVFNIKGKSWEVVSEDARITVDNQPQIDRERLIIENTRKDEWAKVEILSNQSQRAMDKSSALSRTLGQLLAQAVDWKQTHDQQLPGAVAAGLEEESRQEDLARAEELTALHEYVVALGKFTSSNPLSTVTAKTTHFVPTPALAILFLILPALAYRSRVIRMARKRAGLCPDCGYDLRATPSRCPECGLVPAQAGGK